MDRDEFFDYMNMTVSIIQLISDPTKYHGKMVRVIGVGDIEFESDAVYLHYDDWKYGIGKNGLCISFGKEIDCNIVKEYNGKYVLIEGVFSKEQTKLWAGGIFNITRYELWNHSRTE